MKRTPSERITLQQFADMLGLSYVRTKIIARANAERLDKRVAEHVAGRPASLDRAACVRFAAERGEMSIWNPGIIFCRKIPTASKAPEPTGKATWTAKGLPEMSIRTTKRQILDHLELAIMELNALGTENAKLKNAIARMKRSAR